MKVVGVGCVWFAPALETERREIKRDEFLKSLKVALERLENVSNVQTVSVLEKPFMNLTAVERGNDTVIVPILHGCRLSCDIYLPYRIQEKFWGKLAVERWSIIIHFAYEMPIMYVHYSQPEGNTKLDPSSVVVVTRKYLEQKLDGTDIRCGCVGPSPFHADFKVIVESDTTPSSLREAAAPSPGYGSFEIVVSTNSDQDFLKALFHHKDVFGKFYLLSNLRSAYITHKISIASSARELVAVQPSNILKRMASSFRQSKPIDKMNEHLVLERLIRMDMEGALERGEQSGLIGDGTALDRYFEEYRHTSKQTNWSEFSQVAKFFEDRRHHIFRNLTAVIAGLIGGLVGAVIGSLLTYVLTVAR
jgi:hypothetical protein